jgi:hypothetical protein
MKNILHAPLSHKTICRLVLGWFLLLLLVYIVVMTLLVVWFLSKRSVSATDVIIAGAAYKLHARKAAPYFKRKILGRK